MPIKVGFSSSVCPGWDFKTIVRCAGELGYDGVVLSGLAGQDYLPGVSALVDDPASARALAGEAGVKLVSLAAPASLESPSAAEAKRSCQILTETIELAGKLGCPYVSVRLGRTVGGEHRGTLSRVAAQLSAMAPLAARHRIVILVENAGDFTNSEDLWFVIDAVAHPAVRGCWNPLYGRIRGERPTTSVPRLGRKIDMFYVTDGRFDDAGLFRVYELPGQGDLELDHAIDLLKGVCYQGWLVFDWPRTAPPLKEPESVLPTVLEFVRQRLAHTDELLSAYKGDKRPPNFHAPPAVELVADK